MALALPASLPPFRIALVEPDIAGNTGNIARLCAATRAELHLVEPLGFALSDSRVRRAGLDYWDSVCLVRHRSYAAFERSLAGQRMLFFSTKATRSYTDAPYRPGDVLVFGSETKGLSEELLAASSDRVFGIPMCRENVRSLNVANAVAIVVYEALRQIVGAGESPGTGP
ncbi:MAG: tRNA (cytidine(34)-2'-O)-methyltransferase [Verrucomicrobia bacterium]|nr:tRNA (cytidine(34)-2'-O)-methyltransferase [Verrucomicrobiota bacterium]MDA1085880.1 tRNA (cytidine(34)-2'-O)-methyltransferase [Verrucomicrobiota bacterium]